MVDLYINENKLQKKLLSTDSGSIVYWVSLDAGKNAPWLVFLPGLTADHRLFTEQLRYFVSKANFLVWDPPSHGESRPFSLDWTLDDLARWVKELLDAENIEHPILIGQSMGGYVSQNFIELFPGVAKGFVSIDSAPLQREYYSWWELAALKHTKLMYLSFPWKTLITLGSTGTSKSPFGQQIMRDMMLSFNKREFCKLAAHGYKALAKAVETERSYEIDCPVLLICGTKDAAGSTKRYNREWEMRSDNMVHWIEGAGHNANCDEPELVNKLIKQFVESIQS